MLRLRDRACLSERASCLAQLHHCPAWFQCWNGQGWSNWSNSEVFFCCEAPMSNTVREDRGEGAGLAAVVLRCNVEGEELRL